MIRNSSQRLVTNQEEEVKINIFAGSESGVFSAINWGSSDVISAAERTKLAGIEAGAKTYSVGDFAHGGIVFWVDETGQHGLVCAKTDQSTGVRWYAGTNGNTQVKGDGPLAGKMNTAKIIAAHVAIGDDGGPYAARICNKLQVMEGKITYDDWYLPSKEELNLMYQNSETINTAATANGGTAFASGVYWSSNESDSYSAWGQNFGNGMQANYDKARGGHKANSYRVRAVRAF